MNKLSIFASVGAISIIGVGVLTFTKPVATATPSEASKPSQALQTTKPAEVVKDTTSTVTAPVEPPVTSQAQTTAIVEPDPEQIAPPAPVILSTQEYGEKYLNLSQTETLNGQACFDKIVAFWPERFSPELREKNVKSLRVWGHPCSATQVLDITHRDDFRYSLIARYGQAGEFFDSSAAQHSANRP